MISGNLNAYTGAYSGRARGSDMTITIARADNQLQATSEGRPPLKLKYAGEDTWYSTAPGQPDQLFIFRRQDGEVRELRVDAAFAHYVLGKE